MANTFGALIRIDFVNLFARENRLVRTLGFAHVAVDALVGDHQGHGYAPCATQPACARPSATSLR